MLWLGVSLSVGEFMIKNVSCRQIGDVVSFNSEIIRRELCHSWFQLRIDTGGCSVIRAIPVFL